MKHKRLLIITTCLVFVMICVLALRELFTVKDITVVYSVTSNEVTEEVLSLLEKYKDESIFGIDVKEIGEEITKNRYLKVLSVEKKYPNEIVINLRERVEKYYYVAKDATYYFDDEYFVVKSSPLPPQGEHYLTEISFEEITGEAIEVECGLKSTFTFPNGFNGQIETVISGIESIASSVVEISFITTPEDGNYRIRLKTREGVTIEVRKAGDGLAEKLDKGVNAFISLEEAKKIDGVIIVNRTESGHITAVHTFNG